VDLEGAMPSNQVRWNRVPDGDVRRNRLADRTAEQRRHRLTGAFAAQIPQRQIDTGQRHDRQALAAEGERRIVHLLPALFDRLQRPADEQLAHNGADDMDAGSAAAADAEAGQALIGVHGDQDLSHARAPIGRRVRGNRLAGADVRDLHWSFGTSLVNSHWNNG